MWNPVLISTLLGAVAPVLGEAVPDWIWSGSGFGGGCSPAACTWTFNITAPDYYSSPGFSAYCTGNTLQNNDGFVDCEPSDPTIRVAARLGGLAPPTYANESFYVTYAYITPLLPNITATYNFTGRGDAPYGRYDPGNHDFFMSPNDVQVTTQVV